MGAYVHFPFCRNICDFCGYETRLIKDRLAAPFPARARSQIDWHLGSDDVSRARLQAVFFGGGTASLIPERGFRSILEALMPLVPNGLSPEVTLECEPGTITLRRLQSARKAGLNRISVGAQSLSNERLKRIGRKHTAEDAIRLVEASTRAGIENIHIDLMYGLPEQSVLEWEDTVRQTAALPVTHVSIYKLYVFLFGALHRGKVVPRPESESRDETNAIREMYEVGRAILTASGFQQYSLTEFARPGWQSKYIHACFNGNDLLPVGPGAFGRCGNELWENAPYVHQYVTDEEVGRARAYQLTPIESFKRDVILGLWLLTVDINALASSSGVGVTQPLIDLLKDLAETDRLEFSEGKLRVAPHQRFDIGSAMQSLAELDVSQWGLPDEEGTPVWATRSPHDTMKKHELPAKLGTLFRTARRDKQLFDRLKLEPMTTLRECCQDLTNEQLEFIANVIRGTDVGKSGGLVEEIRQTWVAVTNEHPGSRFRPAFSTE
jgi:oxygen-independent coproporphyrinogen-3 oxidase